MTSKKNLTEEFILCDGKYISKEENPIAYNTLKNVLNFCCEHKVDERVFKNPRIRMYYAVDNEFNIHCSAVKEQALSVLNKFEDEVIMNISTFNKLKQMIENERK